MEQLVIADILSLNVDGRSQGHYFTVATNYLELFGDRCDVRVAGGPVYYSHYENKIKLKYDSSNKQSAIINKLKVICNGRRVLKEAGNANLVFQCSAVSTILLCLALFRTKAKVFLIQYDTAIVNSKIKRLLFKLVKHKINGIICPGAEIGKVFDLPYCVVPDYIYGGSTKINNDARDISTMYDFGIYGILAKGKGVLEAAQFFSKTNYRVMIAGRQGTLAEDEEMIEQLKRICADNENLTLSLGYLSNEKYQDYIRGTKYCVLNYSESYALRSSGVIYDILFNGRPVLAKERKYVEFVKENDLGAVYSDLEDLDFNVLLENNQYKTYISNIKKYLDDQKKNSKRLINFITGGYEAKM